MKAYTTFGAGASATAALSKTLQPLPAGVTTVNEVVVPTGANPSKLGTWIQRAAVEGNVSDDVPAEYAEMVDWSAKLLSDPTTALAINMAGSPAGDKMLAKLGGVEGDSAYLLFGLVAE